MFSLVSSGQTCRMSLGLQLVLVSAALVHSTDTRADCWGSSAAAYRGQKQTSSSGLTCLNWTNVSEEYDPQTGVGDHNYCRDPDSSGKPWCYIGGPGGSVQKQFCAIEPCPEQTSTAASVEPVEASPPSSLQKDESSQDEGAAKQPVMGISQRVRSGTKQKKDLGTLGYVVGGLMIAIIILLGAGITLGYFYKRARDIKKQHEQRVYEREMQRINLPLSAFANPTCELVDENTIVITAQCEPTPVGEEADGADPLMGQPAGTPGA